MTRTPTYVLAQVEVKTKKLKKLWSKYQTAHREIKDIQEEFQQERSDMLDTIRELTRQLKLKEVYIVYRIHWTGKNVFLCLVTHDMRLSFVLSLGSAYDMLRGICLYQTGQQHASLGMHVTRTACLNLSRTHQQAARREFR